MTHVLFPIWIGIFFNVLVATVNLACIGHGGRIVSAWMRHQTLMMTVVWFALICWAIRNAAA